LISVYHIRMFAKTLARIAAKLPSSVKYRMGKLKPLYTRAMRLGQSTTIVETPVGKLRWQIDALTSQEFLRGTYEPYMQAGFVDFVARGPSDRAGMRGEVPPLASLADSAAIGVEVPASGGTGAGTR